MNKMKLNQLEILVAVAEAGGFSAAAAELGCTQSRISHAITELEMTLGARLLTRSRSGCIPTDAGHRVLSKARQILRLVNGIADTSVYTATLVGRVRITCFRSVGTHLLPHALAALALDFPGIRVDIDDGCEERDEVTQAVTHSRADIGIAQLPVGEAFVARPFVADSYVLVAPTSLQLASPVCWEQLNGLPYLQLNCAGAFAILDRCRAAGFDAQPSRTLTTDTGIVALIKHGLGYSILPRLAVFPEPNGVQIADLPIRARRQFAIVAMPEMARSKLVQTVMRALGNRPSLANSEVFRAGLVDWG